MEEKRKVLKEKIESLVKSSKVKEGSLLVIPEEQKKELAHIHGISLQINNSLEPHIKDRVSMEYLIIDYFLRNGEYKENEEEITFNDSMFYNDLSDHIEKIIQIISTIPFEYTFILPLNISDSRLSSLDQQLSPEISLKGLTLNTNLYWQYLLNRSASEYFGGYSDFTTTGESLALTGTYKGYLFK